MLTEKIKSRKTFIKEALIFFSILFLFAFSKQVVRASESISYIHTDHLGSTILVTDENGDIVTNQVYYPYGDVRNVGVKLPTEKAYTGQVSDEDETGMYYYNARYYNSVSGIFTQADTANDNQNRYAYVKNSPINLIDPSGHDGQEPEERLEFSDWVEQNWDKIAYPSDYDCADLIIHMMVMYAKVYNLTIKFSVPGYATINSSSPYYKNYDDFSYYARRAFGGKHLKYFGKVIDIADPAVLNEKGRLIPGDVITVEEHSLMIADKLSFNEALDIYMTPGMKAYERVQAVRLAMSAIPKEYANLFQSQYDIAYDQYVQISSMPGEKEEYKRYMDVFSGGELSPMYGSLLIQSQPKHSGMPISSLYHQIFYLNPTNEAIKARNTYWGRSMYVIRIDMDKLIIENK